MSGPFCPATMCPLFAKDGSPWTGEYDAPCPGHDDIDCGGCPWWSMGGCSDGGPFESVAEALHHEGRAMVVGPNRPKRDTVGTPREYDCPRASECQWQIRAGDRLCPPRAALSHGLDPRVSAF